MCVSACVRVVLSEDQIRKLFLAGCEHEPKHRIYRGGGATKVGEGVGLTGGSW